MASYRAVVRHVRYWKGQIHRWSTSYTFTGGGGGTPDSTDCATLLTNDDAMCYSFAAADGGTYACEIYDLAAGGSPIASHTAFDYTVPADWIPYSSDGWAAPPSDGFEISAEVALLVEWAGGLSRTGKPVTFRKWFHAVPNAIVSPPAAQVSPTNITSLETAATTLQHSLGGRGLSMGSVSGRLAGSPTVQPFYGNHQMPRGRRRKALVTSSGKYTGPTVQIPVLPD